MHICQICNLVLDKIRAQPIKEALARLKPSWVITTNYDLVLESLLESSESVLPFRPLVPSTDRTPVFHLHGHRHHPSSIKITEEDYVSLLGPFDYARLKLPLLLFESTTLMLGYGLGDINVRAAMAWSRSLREVSERFSLGPLQGDVVQALFKKRNPSFDPYLGQTGELVVEIGDLSEFLQDLAKRRERTNQEIEDIRSSVDRFLGEDAPPAALLERGSRDRKRFLELVSSLQRLGGAAEIIDILSAAFDREWAGSITDFNACDDLLGLLVDVLEKIDLRFCHPSLLSYIAEALDKIGWFIVASKPSGSAFVATDFWRRNHGRIPQDVRQELWSIGLAQQHHELKRIFREFAVIEDLPAADI